MKIEKTEVWITVEQALQLNDGRAVRGFFGNLYRNRPEFHSHFGDQLIYKHPLIQYKVFGSSVLVIGLKEGSYLLKALPEIEHLELYYHKYPVIKQNTTSMVVPFGLTEEMISYSFLISWVGFNEKNYQCYLQLRQKKVDTHNFLNKIIIGNILSMCKAVGYTAVNTIHVKATLKEDRSVEIKEDVELMTFKGEFEANFLIPDLWGLGGKVSLGYGSVKCKDGGEMI